MKVQSQRTTHCRTIFRRKALAIAIGGSIALAFAGTAWGQAVTGTIQGSVPAAAGEAIHITGSGGFNRTITVGPSGRYSITLPVGEYTVSLLRDGKVMQSFTDVAPAAAGAVTVNFAAPGTGTQTLSTVNVTANTVPPIDVTTTNLVTTITSAQLKALPLGRSAADIAMLAPGVSMAAPALGGGGPPGTAGSGPLGSALLVFGGASAAENAYYVDGMNTTDPITGQGGVTLPYGAIQQQQTFTSGYGAKYGRSIGGVINQIGQAGSNQWHFGARAIFEPSEWRSAPVNRYWNSPFYSGSGPGQTPSQGRGQLQGQFSQNRQQTTTYDAYVSGPIIKNRLTFFLGVEQDNTSGNSVASLASASDTHFQIHAPKIYAKINWNINDSNILTISGLQNEQKEWQTVYGYDNTALKDTKFLSEDPITKTAFRMWVANYTSYLTDDLTLNAMYGRQRGEFFVSNPNASPLPYIASASKQNPNFLPPGSPGISNANQAGLTTTNPGHIDTIENARVSLDYKLPWHFFGTHDVSIGIDNMQTWDEGDGNIMTGPGYGWVYAKHDPTTDIVGADPDVAPWVGATNTQPNGSEGYYVERYVFNTTAGVRVNQKAQYIQDKWQMTPNLLLQLGLRNDQFTNYNADGVPYIKLTSPQWAPRLGFSWDVHGDQTLKVFGNAGRYYLALPAGPALRAASASTFWRQYYTYSGVDSNGEPTGLNQIAQNNGGHGTPATVGVSANNEYGIQVNPNTVTSSNIKAEYSDNFSLGMDQEFNFRGQKYVFGANALYEKMGPDIVDDWDDLNTICEQAWAQGVIPQSAYAGANAGQQLSSCTSAMVVGSVLINPTQTSKINILGPDGKVHGPVVVTNEMQGFERKVSRQYYAVNLSLEHPFDGKWFGKIVYTWSREYGNTEGPVDTNVDQGATSVSITELWDFAQLMEHSYGPLANNHTNMLKAYGFYQLNPQWQISGNFFVASGTPFTCLGLYGAEQSDPLGYGNAYHYCGGVPTALGTWGTTPWVHSVGLGATWRPVFADHKLAFNLSVQNLLNNQTVTQWSGGFGTTVAPDATFKLPLSYEAPRQWRFEVSYDF